MLISELSLANLAIGTVFCFRVRAIVLACENRNRIKIGTYFLVAKHDTDMNFSV